MLAGPDYENYPELKNIKELEEYDKSIPLNKVIQDFEKGGYSKAFLEPKHLKVYSFRIDRKYRAIFIIINGENFH